MTEKRFNFNLTLGEDEHKGLVVDNGKILKTTDVVYLLNKKEEEITFLKSACMELEDANGRLEERLDYIQNSISNAIKHQKTKIGEKALREVIRDYNEWMLGHKESVKK